MILYLIVKSIFVCSSLNIHILLMELRNELYEDNARSQQYAVGNALRLKLEVSLPKKLAYCVCYELWEDLTRFFMKNNIS